MVSQKSLQLKKPIEFDTLKVFKEAEKNQMFRRIVWPGPKGLTSLCQSHMTLDKNNKFLHVVWESDKTLLH